MAAFPPGARAAADAALETGHTYAKVSIAAAANLVFVLEPLNAAYLAANPTTQLTLATGASGNLVAQIRHGAPYDVFLSADLSFAQSLVNTQDADGATLQTFARGQLVLWTANDRISGSTVTAMINDPATRKIALANPKAAPYGRAAQEVLETLHLWETTHPRVVFGENISQTIQFVETGNADVGFVALSLVLSPQLKTRGRWIAIAADQYSPLDQAAVITRAGAANPEAAKYLAFLRTAQAREILSRFGYLLP